MPTRAAEAIALLGVLGVACERAALPGREDSAASWVVLSEVPVELVVQPQLACDADGGTGFVPVAPGPDWEALPGASLAEQSGWGFAVADLNGDDLIDVFFPQFGQDNLLFGQADGSFVDATDLLPVEDEAGMSALAFDSDGDGDLDLYVGQVGPNALYENDGQGGFTRVPDAGGAANGARYTQHVAAGDLDGDGALDLFLANFNTGNERGEPNGLYRNRGDGTFEDISERINAGMEDWPTNAGGWVDVDGDGDQDLFVVTDKESLGTTCLLYLNEGGALTLDDGGRGANIAIDGMGLALAELNGDHQPEMLVTGTDEIQLLMSVPDGTRYDAARALGLLPDERHFTGWGPDFADLDNDGDLDLLVAFGVSYDLDGTISPDQSAPHDQSLGLWEQLGDHTFLESSEEWGLAALGSFRGFVLVDLNHDGALDLIDRDTWSAPRVYQGRCPMDAWLELELRAPAPNTYAVGARVEVDAGALHAERVVYAGTTNITVSGPYALHFGLGRADEIDALRVIWPDGQVTTLTDLPARQRLRLTRTD